MGISGQFAYPPAVQTVDFSKIKRIQDHLTTGAGTGFINCPGVPEWSSCIAVFWKIHSKQIISVAGEMRTRKFQALKNLYILG